MKIALSAETTVDFSKELLEKYNIKTVPFTIVMGGMEYLDGEIDNEQMFDFVRETKLFHQLAQSTNINMNNILKSF